MKKILLILMSCIVSASMAAFAQRAVKLDGVIYSIDTTDGYATALKTYDEVVNLVIPAEIELEGKKYPVTYIEKEAFKDAALLETLQIGNAVEIIGDKAFYNCSGLKAVSIPGSVVTLGYDAFAECSGLSEVAIEAGTAQLECIPLDKYEPLVNPFKGCDITNFKLNRLTKNIGLRFATVRNVELGEACTSLADGVFSHVTSLESVTIKGNTLETIGEEAFYECASLKYINLPESLREVKARAFHRTNWADNMPATLELRVPSRLEIIGGGAFSNCKLQNTLILDRKVIKSVGSSAFSSCKVDTVLFTGGWVYIPEGILGPSSVKYVDLGDDVIGIRGYAFSGCSKLRFHLPESVEAIGDFALSGCSALSPLTIPESVNSLGLGNFRVNEIRIEDSDKPLEVSIGYERIVFPDEGCAPPLRAYWYTCEHNGNPTVQKLYIGRPLKFRCTRGEECQKGKSAFEECSTLKEVTLASCDTIYPNMFYKCDNLTKVTIIPKADEYIIGDRAFSDCTNLSSIEFPVGLNQVGANVFKNGGLKELTLRDVIPPMCENNAFDDSIYDGVTLYVPSESVGVYETSMPWIFFKKIVGVDFSEIEEVGTDADEAESPVEYFDLSGMRVNGENLAKGIYLRRQGTKVTKVAVN